MKKQVSVAIIGMDGTGKSSVIEKLKMYYGDRCFCQYMGFKNFTTNLGKIFGEKCNKKMLDKLPHLGLIIYYIAMYIEMIKRIKIAKKTKREIIIYDRYAWETFINSTSLFNQLFSWIFFKKLFPDPTAIVYLHCKPETSFARKKDILNQEEFILMKRKNDDYFKNDSSILTIDTDLNDEQNTKKIIINFLEKSVDTVK